MIEYFFEITFPILVLYYQRVLLLGWLFGVGYYFLGLFNRGLEACDVDWLGWV